jgi:hypothetical protein
MKKQNVLFSILIFLLGLKILIISPEAWAKLTQPSQDSQFENLPGNIKLSSIRVSGSTLALTRGKGNAFSAKAQAAYLKLKKDSQSISDFNVQWVFMNLDTHQIIEQSLSSQKKIFGASSSKVFVGATLINQQNGDLNSSQRQKMADMLVVSSNSAWTDLQTQIGAGNSNLGRERIQQFTQSMGYLRMRGFQGNWGGLHGNELTALESAEFLYDTYNEHYQGAETLWKLMHTVRTGSEKGFRYIPSSIYVGGKTGTYSGESIDPETGSSKNPNGSPYKVSVRNHILVFYMKANQYAISVLANSGTDDSAALLVGGLIREHRLLK